MPNSITPGVPRLSTRTLALITHKRFVVRTSTALLNLFCHKNVKSLHRLDYGRGLIPLRPASPTSPVRTHPTFSSACSKEDLSRYVLYGCSVKLRGDPKQGVQSALGRDEQCPPRERGLRAVNWCLCEAEGLDEL